MDYRRCWKWWCTSYSGTDLNLQNLYALDWISQKNWFCMNWVTGRWKINLLCDFVRQWRIHGIICMSKHFCTYLVNRGSAWTWVFSCWWGWDMTLRIRIVTSMMLPWMHMHQCALLCNFGESCFFMNCSYMMMMRTKMDLKCNSVSSLMLQWAHKHQYALVCNSNKLRFSM